MESTLPLQKEERQEKIAIRQITWVGPLGMIFARSLVVILAQLLMILIFTGLRHPDPLRASTAWWQVTGTLVDLGCLALLIRLTRHEGIRPWDLIGLDRSRQSRDVLVGLGLFGGLFAPVMLGGSLLTGWLVFGTFQPVLPVEIMAKSLPLWAALYARLIWWVIWSATEEITYNGYALPRLLALTGGRKWLAVAIVGFCWALQHAFLPFIPDGRVFLFLFLQMLPLVIVMQVLYLRFRRLPPLIVMHWGMDLFSAIFMISIG